MDSVHNTLGRTADGLVTARVYEDGDVVICHGERGNCVNMQGVAGHAPILNASDRLDLPFEYETQVVDFVRDNEGVFAEQKA